MKKLLVILSLTFAFGFCAQAQFFYGLQFGLIGSNGTNSGSDTELSSKETFNYTLKPSVGYAFSSRLQAGVKFVYTDCSADSSSLNDLNYYLMNALMGNGFDMNYMSWNVKPYVRYKATSILHEKLNIWVELNGYYGQKMPRVDNQLDKGNSKAIYGVSLHPLISLDLNERYSLFTSLDFLSFDWSGEASHKTYSNASTRDKVSNTFIFQCNPLIAIARGVVNFGVMRRF